MLRPISVALTLLLFCSLVSAQRSRCDPANLRLKVLYNTSRSARNHTQVDLLTASGSLVARRFTDDSGNVDFLEIPAQGYRVRVADSVAEDTVSDEIDLACGESRSEMVTAKLKASAENELKQEDQKEALVSALDLNVPGSARKEFEKGAQAMQDGDTPNAMKHLLKAVDIYPQYALAYNHLGVLYMQAGQPDKGRAAFEKAVELNDHYPSALLNLAKLRFQDRKMADVEMLLRKAVAVDAANPESLALLSDAEIVNGHLDDALANVTKLHTLPHPQFAAIHVVAGDALVKANRPDEALVQYNLFLQEAPGSQAADHARKAIAGLKKPQSTR